MFSVCPKQEELSEETITGVLTLMRGYLRCAGYAVGPAEVVSLLLTPASLTVRCHGDEHPAGYEWYWAYRRIYAPGIAVDTLLWF